MTVMRKAEARDDRVEVLFSPQHFDCEYDRRVHDKFDCLCANLPGKWPSWHGGQYDFLNQGQPFDKFEELRLSTMCEF
jgi:hypothetical protein